MDLDKIKEALSSEICSTINNDGKNKLASVLILIYGQKPKILMTEKPKTMSIHGGEISFPGGKWIDTDKDLIETALRETREEIHLKISREQVIGQLEPVTTLNSRFTIASFVSILNDVPELKANSEVASILHIPMEPFLKTLADDTDPNHKSIQEMYTLTFMDKLVWGASARMLKQIVTLLSKNNVI